MEWKEQKKLQERYGKLTADMRSMVEKAEKEDRSLTADEKTSFEASKKEVAEIRERLMTIKDVEDFDARQLPGYVELTQKEERQYSLLSGIRSLLDKGAVQGFEKEVSDEIASKTGKTPRGFYMPFSLATRDMTTTTGTGAVGTAVQPTLIELLRSQLIVGQLGAQMLTGLQGSIGLPRQDTSVTASWVTEGNNSGESNATIGQVTLTPSVLNAYTELTRNFIKQTSVDAENFARMDLVNTLSVELDRTAIDGSGSGAEPAGITNTASVNTVSATGDPWADLVSMQVKLLEDKALRGSLAYLLSPGAVNVAKNAIKGGSGSGRYVLEGGEIDGYRALATNHLDDNLASGSLDTVQGSVVFGNFNDLIIGMWSAGVEILINPYIVAGGTVRIEGILDADVQVRHAASFAVCDDFYD